VTYLLDADWIISFLYGRAEAVDLVSSLADEGIAVSIIAYGEICEGLLGGPSPAERRVQLEAFLSTVEMLSLDVDVANQFAEIRIDLRSRGMLIPDNDTWIAATARAHDLTLVSRDAHFRRIPNLRIDPNS
jgi:tRNA(fMet)-specific endonuclease VapC